MDWDNRRLAKVLAEVQVEREQQYLLYGLNPFNDRVGNMLFVLGEEVGEVNAAMVEYKLAEIKADNLVSTPHFDVQFDICKEKIAHIRKELIQVAAVAVATVELIDYHKEYDGEEVA